MTTIEDDAMKKLDGIYQKKKITLRQALRTQFKSSTQNAAIRSASDEGKGGDCKN